MRIAYLDCFSGISGDMFLGALVDAGLATQVLKETVTALNRAGDLDARIDISRVMRGGISATKVDVWAGKEKDRPRTMLSYAPEHHHEHSHQHSHEHRGLKEIKRIIAAATLSEPVKSKAVAIFEALGAAEAKLHNTDIEKIHFHEVGAADAMVDIVGAAAGSEALGIEAWVCSPLNLGSGSVECAHGTLPVPAPATVELLRDAPVYSSGIQAELVTPTGAAIVRGLGAHFASLPEIKLSSSGYGAGSRDFHGHANVLRIVIGESAEAAATLDHGSATEIVTVLEATLDDLNPQVFGYVLERALAEGALEVFTTPVHMKKNRPGMLLTVLAQPRDAARLAKLIFSETTTLGVRAREEKRHVLPRRWDSVHTAWGEVRMKVASLNGGIANYAPEYEDCRRIATAHHVPLKRVMQEAVRLYLERKNA